MKIQSLQVLVERLIERGFVFETRASRTLRSGRDEIIEVGDTTQLSAVVPVPENSTNYYLEVIRQSKFSWLLFDASLIQIWYKRRGAEIIAHRYCYIPCPFETDLRVETDSPYSDLIEVSCTQNPYDQARRTILRFEYEPLAASPNHPAAHLHLNANNCRIPMKSGFSVREFIYFILRFFYSETFDASALAIPQFNARGTLTGDDEQTFHLNWRI